MSCFPVSRKIIPSFLNNFQNRYIFSSTRFTSAHNHKDPKSMLGVETSNGYPNIGSHFPASVNNVIDGMPRYPTLKSAAGFLRGCDYFGTVIFAISGSITAASSGMDIFGATTIGTITALGGGTIRDAVILHKQAFWIVEEEYFFMACFVAFLTFLVWPHLPKGNVIKNKNDGEGDLLWWGDAIGVGAFSIIGAMNACRMCVNPILAVVCGVITATFGGMTRDVVCGLPKTSSRGRIFHSHSDIYATTAAVGASSYMMARYFRASMLIRICSGLIATIGLRWIAKSYDLGLPSWTKMNFDIEKDP